MPNLKNEAGNRHGRLVVIARAPTRNGYACWRCLCDCGATTEVRGAQLRNGHIVSCGCYVRELNARRMRTHGLSASPLMRLHGNIKQRCTNPKTPKFHNYGGRGIGLHPPWHDFATFAADIVREIGEPPDGKTLDRIDNDGDYKPGNVRWATYGEQNRNQRHSKLVQFRGETMNRQDLAERNGVDSATLAYRLNVRKMSAEEAVAERSRSRAVYVRYRGKVIRLAEAARRSGIPYDTLRQRVSAGWPDERLFEDLNR